MKRLLCCMLISLATIAGANIGQSIAGDITPANIRVKLNLLSRGSKSVNSFLSGEPIIVILSLKNVGSKNLITSKGFRNKDFHNFLHFTFVRPDGKKELITAKYPKNQDEPGPPRVKFMKGKLIQVEEVEVLQRGWGLKVEPFNAFDYYSLGRTGRWMIKAVIPMRTYPRKSLLTFPGETYARLTSPGWGGDLESNTISFSIIDDRDGDGYCYPEFRSERCREEEIDCDDSKSKVNPGAAEIPGNGIDDDCNPKTPDKVASAQGTIIIKVMRYTLDKSSRAASTEEPIPGIQVKVFDRSARSCVKGRVMTRQSYESVWQQCITRWVAITNHLGTVGFRGLPPGDYLVITEYDPDRYDGVDKDKPGNEIYVGWSVLGLKSGQIIKKRLQVKVKATGKKLSKADSKD